MRKYTYSITAFLSLILAMSVYASTSLYDEAVSQGPIDSLDCVGAGIACTRQEMGGRRTGVLTVSGGGGGGSLTHPQVMARVSMGF